MSNEEIIVRSEVTEKTAGLDLFLRGIRKSLKFNALGKSKTIYSMVALTSPIKIDEASASIFSNSSLLKQAAALFKELTERSQGKFMFFARLDGPNTAHSFIPNPCTLDFAKDIEAAAKLISLHTLVVSSEASAIQSPISAGDVVLVRLRNGNIQEGELVGLDTASPLPEYAKACQDLASTITPSAKYSFSSGGFTTSTAPMTTISDITSACTEPLDDGEKAKMSSTSLNEEDKKCPVPFEDLCSVGVKYVSRWGDDATGTIIVHKEVAAAVAAIFEELYEMNFMIQSISPMYNYNGDDDRSMRDNNTSAFNCRMKTNSQTSFSEHSYGLAIDINPLTNPYVRGNQIEPPTGAEYIDSDREALAVSLGGRGFWPGGGIVTPTIAAVFKKHGFQWGGDWTGSTKDYQHFSKSGK
jgi:hypothetical protein